MMTFKFNAFVNEATNLLLDHVESYQQGKLIDGDVATLYSRDITLEIINEEIDTFAIMAKGKIDDSIIEKNLVFKEIINQCAFKEATLTI